MKALKFARNPYTSLVINFAYAIDNCMIGFLAHSWWFITVGAYYTVLAATRFSVLQIKRKANGNYGTELFAKRISNLLSVKSIVTIACTAVFAYQAVTDSISQDFMTIYAVIIAFYFGTQAKEASNGNG